MDDLDVSIRLGDADDLAPLHALIERAYRGEEARGGWTHEADLLDGQRITAREVAGALDDPQVRVLVAEAKGAIIGSVQVTRRTSTLAYLGLLCVDPAFQAGGLGRMLLAEAEAVAAATFGARAIEMTVIDVRAELIAYYRRRGYAPTGEARPFPIAVEPPLSLTVLEKPL